MRHVLFLLSSLLLFLPAVPSAGQPIGGRVMSSIISSCRPTASGCITSKPGRPPAHTLVLVPGWTMPAWIWMPQILAFSQRYHVVAFDPRGQGNSAAPRRRL